MALRAAGGVMERDPLTEKIIGLAIEVHRALGPGLLESAYEECLCHDLKGAGFGVRRQVPVPLVYREIRLDSGYRADVLVNDSVLLEIKSIERLMPIHEAQMLTYLKLAKVKTGLLLNFNVEVLRQGIRRFVQSHAQQLESSAASAPLR